MGEIGHGDRLLLRFHTNAAAVHERFVLTCDLDGTHFAVTPSRARVAMTLTDGAVRDMWLVQPAHPDRLPRGVNARDVSSFENSPAGPLQPHELAYFLTHGRELEAWHAAGGTGVPPPFTMPGPPGTGPSLPLVPRPAANAAPACNVIVPVADLQSGAPLSLERLPHQVFNTLVLFQYKGETGLGVIDRAERVAERLEDFWRNVRTLVPVDFRYDADATPRGEGPVEDGGSRPTPKKSPAPSPAAGPADEDDLRLLPGAMIYDESRERWRSMTSAVGASFEDEFPDWPIEGPRSLYFALKELRLESKNFLEHHQAWLVSSGLHKSDRAAHEHEVLCSALHMGLCYDQLNVVNCAWAERVDKRRALLEKAYRDGGGQAPNFEGAEFMFGRRRPIDGTLIDPAVLKFTGERMHQKAEVDKQARLARAEKSARFSRQDIADDEDGAGGGRPSRADKRAKAVAAKAAAAAGASGGATR